MVCKFDGKYYNYEEKTYLPYQCSEKALESGYCIFHDCDFVKYGDATEKAVVNKRFNEIVEEKVEKNQPVVFLGANLVDVDIHQTFTIGFYFFASIFHGKVSFDKTKFMKTADFSHTKFCGYEGITCFNEVEFRGGNALFTGIRFQHKVSFQNTKFLVKQKIDFIEGFFLKGAVFSSAEFSAQEIRFSRVICQNLYMDYTSFLKFDFVYFNDIKCVHSKMQTSFYKSKFLGTGIVNFVGSYFFGSITFLEGTFDGPKLVDFSEIKCYKLTNFSECRFSNEIRFIDCKFQYNTHLNFVIFESQEKVFFRTRDLTFVSFMNTDITRIRFAPKVFFDRNGKFKVFDERMLEKGIKDKRYQKLFSSTNIGNILSLYRNLRENFEFNLRYNEAGRFFVREMEMRRKYSEYPDLPTSTVGKIRNTIIKKCVKHFKTNSESIIIKENWFRRNLFPLGLYRSTSKYGESLFLPIFFLSILILSSFSFWYTVENSSLYFRFVTCFDDKEFSIDSMDIWSPLERSFSGVFPFLPFNESVCFADYSFKILGTVILGLIFIALRRKFERRFRH